MAFGSHVVASYSIGSVRPKSPRVGGFEGEDRKKDKNTFDYWDIDTAMQDESCGKGNCPGVTGLTDAQLKSGLPEGFDPNIWGSNPNINNGYPYLLANPPAK